MTISDTRREQAPTTTAPQHTAGLNRRTLGWSIAVIIGLVAWFFYAWIALGRTVVDSAGESVGTGFLILMVASIVGTVRTRQDA